MRSRGNYGPAIVLGMVSIMCSSFVLGMIVGKVLYQISLNEKVEAK